jgi:hypothetical protein
MTDNNTQTLVISRDLPSFVRPAQELDRGLRRAIHYWKPERTGNFDLDYQRGRQHFREAVEVSFRPDSKNFLAHVLVAMFGHLGPMESGFIDALLGVAPYGAAPPRLTEEEIAASAAGLEQADRLREVEDLMVEAIAVRSWLPDVMRLEIVRLLTGSEGELIGAAVTMLARLALNGLRN